MLHRAAGDRGAVVDGEVNGAAMTITVRPALKMPDKAETTTAGLLGLPGRRGNRIAIEATAKPRNGRGTHRGLRPDARELEGSPEADPLDQTGDEAESGTTLGIDEMVGTLAALRKTCP